MAAAQADEPIEPLDARRLRFLADEFVKPCDANAQWREGVVAAVQVGQSTGHGQRDGGARCGCPPQGPVHFFRVDADAPNNGAPRPLCFRKDVLGQMYVDTYQRLVRAMIFLPPGPVPALCRQPCPVFFPVGEQAIYR